MTLKDTAAFCVTAYSLSSDSAQQQQNKKINSLPKARGWEKQIQRSGEKKISIASGFEMTEGVI